MAENARQYYLDKCDDIVAKAERTGRRLSRDEKRTIESNLERVEEIDFGLALRAQMDKGTPIPARFAKRFNEHQTEVGQAKAIREQMDRVTFAGSAVGGSFSRALLQGFDRKTNPHSAAPLSVALGVKTVDLPGAIEWDVAKGAVTGIGFDKRWIYRNIPTRQVEAGETAVDDFRLLERGFESDSNRW